MKNIRISMDTLMGMKSQCVGYNKDLVKEFEAVRKELLKKGMKKLIFEDTKDKGSRLWFEDRKIVEYDAEKDEALIRWQSGFQCHVGSYILNINRLIVIKSIAEYLLRVA